MEGSFDKLGQNILISQKDKNAEIYWLWGKNTKMGFY